VKITWYGQSAFALHASEADVFIDPFGAMTHAPVRWEYPPITDVSADVLLITHEHPDHNAVELIKGAPHIVRSLSGTFDTPAGAVVGVAGEHDMAAGTERGHVSMFVLELDGLRLVHLSDLGQNQLRPEQVAGIGRPDVLFVPVGGGSTLGAIQAKAVARQVDAGCVVPMHYRTALIDFLEPVDEFLTLFDHVEMLQSPTFDTNELPDRDGAPVVVVPAVPSSDGAQVASSTPG
jgi:L-ascorbate metabolism protein UlaG (beta-lactamase superfamily)